MMAAYATDRWSDWVMELRCRSLVSGFICGYNEFTRKLYLRRAGYRHIDTAHAYMDERGVGDAVNEFIAEGGCKREDIWVTSKIWPSEYSDPTAAIDRMLRRLNLDYVDLVYPHQPVGDIKTAWHNLELAVKQGKVRTLGLNNFEVRS